MPCAASCNRPAAQQGLAPSTHQYLVDQGIEVRRSRALGTIGSRRANCSYCRKLGFA